MSDPYETPPWYEQLLETDQKRREAVVEKALERIKKDKPETFKFIKDFKCELVGLIPRVEYSTPKGPDLDMTWVHPFSGPTLLYWCAKGGFGFFVNVNLNYNESVLDKIPGNRIGSLKGFTG